MTDTRPHSRPITNGQMAEQIANQTERARASVVRSAKLLRQPNPDTFLGRKTQEPFPKEEA